MYEFLVHKFKLKCQAFSSLNVYIDPVFIYSAKYILHTQPQACILDASNKPNVN